MPNDVPMTKLMSRGLTLKEENGDFYVEGFISTPDADNSDILTNSDYPEVILDQGFLVKQISENAQSALASLHHERTRPIGVAERAELRPNPKTGKLSAWVRVKLNKVHEKFKEVVSEIQDKVINGFSIEFQPKNPQIIEMAGKTVRAYNQVPLYGFGLASYGVNPNATITSWEMKESLFKKEEEVEEKKEEGEKPSDAEEPAIEADAEAKASDKEPRVKTMENDKIKEKEATKAPEAKEAKPTQTEDKHLVTKEEYDRLLKLKALEEKESFDSKVVEAVKARMKEFDFSKREPLVSDMPKYEEKEGKIVEKEVLHYVKMLSENAPIDVQYKAAASLINKHPEIIKNTRHNSATVEEIYIVGKEPQKWDIGFTKYSAKEGEQTVSKTYANRLSMKELAFKAGLETDTNLADASWTYGSYYQSPAELNDIYQPIIVNQLNDMRGVWSTLQKENWSAYSSIQFRARTTRNASPSGQAEGYTPSYAGYTVRTKMLQPFCYYYAEVAVSGPEMALAQAPGGMGDVYSDELKWATEDLYVHLDSAILGTGDGTSESAALGFEKLIITTGNLYGLDVTSVTTLAAAGVDNMSSARVTLSQLRKMIRSVVDKGANQGDLVFFCRRIQQDFIKEIIQDLQRIVPTSTRIGFEGVPELDGVPIVDDVNINTDDIFLIDSKHTKIALKVAPTYEETAKTIDRRNGYIKTYFNLYSSAPNHNYWAYGFATS